MGDITNMRDDAHNLGMWFGVIFWASESATSTDDVKWISGIRKQGYAYQNMGINPDFYSIESWLNIPSITIPEGWGNPHTFMGAADFFIFSDHYIPR